MIRLALSNTEKDLLRIIRKLEFGEAFELERQLAPAVSVEELQPKERAFIELARQRAIQRLIVHNGEPTSAEFPVSLDGIKCLKKVRF